MKCPGAGAGGQILQSRVHFGQGSALYRGNCILHCASWNGPGWRLPLELGLCLTKRNYKEIVHFDTCAESMQFLRISRFVDRQQWRQLDMTITHVHWKKFLIHLRKNSNTFQCLWVRCMWKNITFWFYWYQASTFLNDFSYVINFQFPKVKQV